jgi:hypothetical protein
LHAASPLSPFAARGEGGAAEDHTDCGEELAGDEELLPE